MKAFRPQETGIKGVQTVHPHQLRWCIQFGCKRWTDKCPLTSPWSLLDRPRKATAEGALQLGYDSSFTTINMMQGRKLGRLLQHTMARCVSIYKYIKNLSVKTDNWLIGATATRLEVKGMYTSQKYSSLVLIDWDSTLCFQSGQDHAAKWEKKKKKDQAYKRNATPTHTSNLFYSTEQCLQLWWLIRRGKGLYTFYFSSFLYFCMMLC